MWLTLTLIASASISVPVTAVTESLLGDIYPDYPDETPFGTKCYKDVGCFSNGPPFYDKKYRPISLLPVDNIANKYLLFTSSSKNKGYNLEENRASLKGSTFNGKLLTIVLAFGYTTNATNIQKNLAFKDEVFKRTKCNFIYMDYSPNNAPPFPQAVANARVNGAKLAHFLKFLMKETGLKAKNIHLIGLSLGAQVAGYAGKRIRNLGRISALDAGGPYFHHVAKEVRVGRDDALFVDAIHSNGGTDFNTGLGLKEAFAHADFYVNGGNLQPQCKDTVSSNDLNKSKGIVNVCSHNAALTFYQNSINTCKYEVDACPHRSTFLCPVYNFLPFKSGRNRMGYHARKPSSPTKYYIKTNAKPPYCSK